jgi:hypothetical protein
MDLQDNGLLSFSPIDDGFEHYPGATQSYGTPQYSPEVANQSQHVQHFQQSQSLQQTQQTHQTHQGELAPHETKKMIKKLQNELDYQVQHEQMVVSSAMPGSGPISMQHPSDIHAPVNVPRRPAPQQNQQNQQNQQIEGFSAALDGNGYKSMVTDNDGDADNSGGTSGAGNGYFSEVWDKRRSVLKIMVITFAILLAISLHNTIYFYVCALIDRVKHRAKWNEVLIRISYPLIILLAMWHLKAYVIG